jgi:elongation factor P
MKISCGDIRPGMIVLFNNKLCKAVKTQHVKPGKGGAYMQVELKDIKVGTKFNERFRTEDTIERAELEQKSCTFSYESGGMYIFLDKETYEEITIPADEIAEDQLPYIQDQIEVEIELFDDKPIGLTLPVNMEFEVVETEPSLKGQTATGSFKPAVLSNGVKTAVPQHINIGDRIIVKTEDSSYSAKAK